MLPEEKDAADLLRRMQTVATQSNLIIKGFKPAPVVTKQLHAEWPIKLELEGTYHNLAMFFDRVGKFTRIVNISGLDVKGRDRAGDANATITATCVATTFVLLRACGAGRSELGAKARAGQGRVSHAATASFLAACLAVAQRRPSAQTRGACSGAAQLRRAAARARHQRPAQARGARRTRARARRRPENYTYQPDGRRDPFLNLLGTGGDAAERPAPERRGRGTDGRRDHGARRAREPRRAHRDDQGAGQQDLHRAPGRQVRRRHDSIDHAAGLVIVQEVNDPLSLVKQREIHKLLRSLEGAKE